MATGCKQMSEACTPGKRAASTRWSSHGVPNTKDAPACPPGHVRDNPTPATRKGRATANPAIGPEIPISRRLRTQKNGDFTQMNAPMVPSRVGEGPKKGSVAETPHLLQV